MKEHGLIFKAPLVRAIIAGVKTETRRPLYVRRKFTPNATYDKRYPPPRGHFGPEGFPTDLAPGECWTLNPMRPKVGDVMWCRETWGPLPMCHSTRNQAVYAATDDDVPDDGKWRPSIHMPRWAARIVRPITAVRIERLQDITDAGAQAEGCSCYVCGRLMDGRSEEDCHCFHSKAAVSDFRNLWASTYGPDAWDLNDWVQVISWADDKPKG